MPRPLRALVLSLILAPLMMLETACATRLPARFSAVPAAAPVAPVAAQPGMLVATIDGDARFVAKDDIDVTVCDNGVLMIGAPESASRSSRQISFALAGITGPGTYELSAATGRTASIVEGVGQNYRVWRTGADFGGTLTITEFSSTRIRGHFTFAAPARATSASSSASTSTSTPSDVAVRRVVTDGRFDLAVQ